MSAADRENETPVQTFERVLKERYQLTPLMPIESMFPMCLAGDDMGEGFMLAAKLIAIQKIHGAPPEDQLEYAMNFIGVSGKYGKERDIQPIPNPEEYSQGLIAMAHNLLVGVERAFANVDLNEFVKERPLSKSERLLRILRCGKLLRTPITRRPKR